MEGILIFTNEGVLEHKKVDGLESEEEYCYWATNKLPKRFTEPLMLEKSARISYEDNFRYEITKEFPIYFAIKGKVRGYFIIHKIREGDVDNEGLKPAKYWLIFYSESWHEIKNGEKLKPSQGWRYYDAP